MSLRPDDPPLPQRQFSRPGSGGISQRRYHAPPQSYQGAVCGRPAAPLREEMAIFRDRTEAGKKLAEALENYRGVEGVVVLAVPRGGVPIALEISQALQVPMDVWISARICAPGTKTTIGSVSEDGEMIVDDALVERMGTSPQFLVDAMRDKRAEVRARAQLYRGDQKSIPLFGKIVIVADDGMATGATMEVVLHALKSRHAAGVIVACPVASPALLAGLSEQVDEFAILSTPDGFHRISDYYLHFREVDDSQVVEILVAAAAHPAVG